MIEASIHDGDVVVVDRSLTPEDAQVVVDSIAGEVSLKVYQVATSAPYERCWAVRSKGLSGAYHGDELYGDAGSDTPTKARHPER
jgi:hypothetical protein